jgi:hypothetical protein
MSAVNVWFGFNKLDLFVGKKGSWNQSGQVKIMIKEHDNTQHGDNFSTVSLGALYPR